MGMGMGICRLKNIQAFKLQKAKLYQEWAFQLMIAPAMYFMNSILYNTLWHPLKSPKWINIEFQDPKVKISEIVDFKIYVYM